MPHQRWQQPSTHAEPRWLIECRGTRSNGRPCGRLLAIRYPDRIVVKTDRLRYIVPTINQILCERCDHETSGDELLGRPAV